MTWGRMDDKFHRNRKVRELRQSKAGREALGVWVFWWSWCLDDPCLSGVIPMSELPPADKKAAKILVAVGLWDEAEAGDYRIHDFRVYNPTKEQREAKLLADRVRVAEHRNANRANVARDSDATKARVASTRDPIPSHPIPSQKKEEMESLRTTPGGAAPQPAAEPVPPEPKLKRQPKQKPKAQQALEQALSDALRKRGDVAPALSQSLAQKSSKRVADYADARGIALEAAAAALVESWIKNGNGNAWRLCDVPFSSRPHVPEYVPQKLPPPNERV